MSVNDITDGFLQKFTGGYFRSIQYFKNDKPVVFGGIINRIRLENGHIKVVHFCSGLETDIYVSSYEFLDLPKGNRIIFRSADRGQDLILMDTSVN